jgi:hypothetical protein
MARAILIVVFVVGAVLTLVGIVRTVSIFDRKDGTLETVDTYSRLWWLGPGLICGGVVVTLGGSIAALFVQ